MIILRQLFLKINRSVQVRLIFDCKDESFGALLHGREGNRSMRSSTTLKGGRRLVLILNPPGDVLCNKGHTRAVILFKICSI